MGRRIHVGVAEPEASAPSLPSDLVETTARRLGWAAWAITAGHVFFLVLDHIVGNGGDVRIRDVTGVVGTVASVGVALLVRRGFAARTVTAIGLGYEIVLAGNRAVVELASGPLSSHLFQTISSVSVIIVLFPFLIPGRPRTILLGSLGAASLLPLGWLAGVLWFDRVPEPAPVLVSYFLVPFACAFIAWVPATVIHHLRAEVGRARRLGSYELIERLGQGGMGEVWRARHRFLARPAAVKLIKPEMLGAAEPGGADAVLRRFEREAQITACLESPNTVELYDFGESTGGDLYYVMELLRGMDLQSLVDRFGPLPPSRVVHLMVQACDSLGEAHARGLVHRDVKPANLYVARKGLRHDVLKVLDFGLVKSWARDPLDSMALGTTALPAGQTHAGHIVGTPAYLAPEAATGERDVDHRSDLYALGCVGYFMLTGERVFDETTPMAMAVAHITKIPEPVGSRSKSPIPEDLAAVVMKCLRKEPEARPATAAELARELGACRCAGEWTPDKAAAWWAEQRADLASRERPVPDDGVTDGTVPARLTSPP